MILVNSVKRPALFIVTVICCISYAVLYVKSSFLKEDSVINEYDKTYCECEGRVEQLSQTDYGVVLLVHGDIAVADGNDENGNKKTVFLHGKKVNIYADEAVMEYISVNDTIKVTGTIRTYEEAANTGNFNARMYYGSIGIWYRISMENAEIVKYADRFEKFISDFRKSCVGKINEVFDEYDAGFVNALLIGDKYQLDGDAYKLYQRNGIAHILAISGLHISFLAGCIYKLARKVSGGYVRPFFVTVLILLVYAVMIGNGLSVKRAVIMCIINMGANVAGRTYDMPTAVSVAFGILVAENPYVVFNSGFQLSFLAVASISVVSDILYIKLSGIKNALLSSFGVSIATLPVIAYNYFEVPLYSLFLNLAVLPLMSFLLIAAVATVVAAYINMTISIFLSQTVHFIITFFDYLCKISDSLPFSRIVTGRPSAAAIFVYYIVLVVIIIIFYIFKENKYIKFRRGIMIVSFVIMCIIILPDRVPEGTLTVDMIDVGQGDSILVRSSDSVIMFDGGSSDRKNVGEKNIYPFLRSYGITRIDYICISHTDTDHVNGIIELMDMQDKNFKIGTIILPLVSDKNIDENYAAIVEKSKALNINLMYTKMGDYIYTGDGVNINVIHPDSSFTSDINEESAVYLLGYEEFSMLLTGDIGFRAEKEILSNDLIKGKINILKCPHHGSANSSSDELLKKVDSDIVIISCGRDNSYGHPSDETLERLYKYTDKVYVTADIGQISFRIKSQNGILKIKKLLHKKTIT